MTPDEYRRLLAATLLLEEARASVALSHDPECQTYSLESADDAGDSDEHI